MNPECVIVDANIAFKTLVANRGDLRDRLSPAANMKFHSPRFLFVELLKHKERLSIATRLNEDELLEALHVLVSRLDFVSEGWNLDGSVSPLQRRGRKGHALHCTHPSSGWPLLDR
jgi:predicted nucleic acid-binding protein